MALVHEALVNFGDSYWTTTDAPTGTGAVTVDSPAAGDITITPDPTAATADTVRRTESLSTGVGALVLTNSYFRFRIKQAHADAGSGAASFTCRIHLRTSEAGPYYQVALTGGNISVVRFVSGTTTDVWAATAFSATDHAFVEVGSNGTNVIARTAPVSNGFPGTWTERGAIARNSSIDGDCRIFVQQFQASFASRSSLILSGLGAEAPAASGGTQTARKKLSLGVSIGI